MYSKKASDSVLQGHNGLTVSRKLCRNLWLSPKRSRVICFNPAESVTPYVGAGVGQVNFNNEAL